MDDHSFGIEKIVYQWRGSFGITRIYQIYG
jgi:hypothetical protein